jgi:YD repeat-containing protein
MKKYSLKSLSIMAFATVLGSCQSSLTSESQDFCQLTEISANDGSSTRYTYNSNNKWETITVSDGSKSTTYYLAYDKTTSNGPVVSIGNTANGSVSVLDYNKDNLLSNVTTNIKKLDKGLILGSKATGTNHKMEVNFQWNSSKQLMKRTYENNVDITINNVTEPFQFSGYDTFEYDVAGNIKKVNYYTNEEIKVDGKIVVKSGLTGYSIFEYDAKSSKMIQHLGLTNLALDIDLNGQVQVEPRVGSASVSKVTFYSVSDDGTVTPYNTTYTNTNNASGYLNKTVFDGDMITFTYKNCK